MVKKKNKTINEILDEERKLINMNEMYAGKYIQTLLLCIKDRIKEEVKDG